MLEKTTLLLAEDDPAVRDFTRSVLEEAGYQVLTAENGRKSLELFESHKGQIQILITDVVMPETNGRELAERAWAMQPDLRVLFVSGYVDRGVKSSEDARRCHAFLEKPFTVESLLDAVESFVKVSA